MCAPAPHKGMHCSDCVQLYAEENHWTRYQKVVTLCGASAARVCQVVVHVRVCLRWFPAVVPACFCQPPTAPLCNNTAVVLMRYVDTPACPSPTYALARPPIDAQSRKPTWCLPKAQKAAPQLATSLCTTQSTLTRLLSNPRILPLVAAGTTTASLCNTSLSGHRHTCRILSCD